MYGPVSLGLSVVVSQTTGSRDIPHRRGSGSGTGPLEWVARGPVPDPETLRYRIGWTDENKISAYNLQSKQTVV